MNDRYQMETDEFAVRFSEYRDKRMVLYGTGRYTAALMERPGGFRFVGLMDRDPAGVGKVMFGLPVMDREEAEKKADMVIINTSETYWDVIYNRIRDMGIPVYYKNGERAEKRERIKAENPFEGLSYEELCAKIRDAEVVSFDFFGTLFMRSVCSPRDVFLLLEAGLGGEWTAPSSCLEIRDRAGRRIRKHYSLEELYLEMEALSGMPHALMEGIRRRELALEKRLLAPRGEVISGLKLALELGREVYVISDMYLPEEFYREALEEQGISMPEGHILLSNVLDAGKDDGTMWRYYTGEIVKGRRALHAGDSPEADINEPIRYGVEAYRTPDAWDMLCASSLRELSPHICSGYASCIMGLVMKELFRSPYRLARTDGTVLIRDNHETGYCIFGPVILTFLLWLLRKSREEGIKKLVFMSRDGYFLKEDFEYLCGLGGEKRECCYLGISRQLAMSAAAVSVEELLEYASMPYSGTVTELFEDRFGITGVKEAEGRKLEEYVEEHLPEMEKHVSAIREEYLHYISGMKLDDGCAVVDLGYYGNNQKYLNRLAGTEMKGYYFNANLSGKNRNAKEQRMTACFQKEDDPAGEESRILKRQIFLESFLTAPYGMVKAVDRDGNFQCAEKRKNQEHFQDRVEMNLGVRQFIYDYMKIPGGTGLEPDPGFADRYYGHCLGGAVEFAEEVKKSFYNDNAMMNRIESMLFY